MKVSNKLRVLSTSLLIGLLSAAVASCGGGGEGPVDPTENLPGNIDSINNDLTIDADGLPEFDEEVEIDFWSIITQPDLTVFEKLVNKFNQEYSGAIHINLRSIGHFDYYSTLENTWATDKDAVPDMLLMHNEKTSEYANKGYMYQLDELVGDTTGVDFDFSQVYENIDRVTKLEGTRYAIPVDAHGFVTSIRQDIVKKNNLGFDGNTRFIPNNRAEHIELLEKARALADAGELWTRDLGKIASSAQKDAHAWKKANKDTFFPSFQYSTDPDGLSALYSNGGTLMDEYQEEVTFHENSGLQQYITDIVEQNKARLLHGGVNTEMFAKGNTLMFAEGPWWVSQQYTPTYNIPELKAESIKIGGVDVSTGISAEDAADPVYGSPYVATNPGGWWTTDENADNPHASGWYGNGHAISITTSVKSMTKVAACLTFAKWLTQGVDDETGNYNLVAHSTSGHLPAWKNVYESDFYAETAAKSVVLKALGDPANIIAMEGLKQETVVFNGISQAIGSVIAEVEAAYETGGISVTRALQILNDTAASTQAMLDFLS